MKRPIVKIGNPVLRAHTRLVPRKILSQKSFAGLIREMIETMRGAQGVGLAANQIGKNLRLFVMECRGNKRYPKVASFPLQAYLNIRILLYSKSQENGWEGCLSVPGFRGLVPRSKKIWVEAQALDGTKIRRTFSGFEARVVQHETDHLNGLFYLDRMKNLKTWTHLEEFNRKHKRNIKDNK